MTGASGPLTNAIWIAIFVGMKKSGRQQSPYCHQKLGQTVQQRAAPMVSSFCHQAVTTPAHNYQYLYVNLMSIPGPLFEQKV